MAEPVEGGGAEQSVGEGVAAPLPRGRGISWPVLSWFGERDAIAEKLVHRVVSHEITKDAVPEAMAHPAGCGGLRANVAPCRESAH